MGRHRERIGDGLIVSPSLGRNSNAGVARPVGSNPALGTIFVAIAPTVTIVRIFHCWWPLQRNINKVIDQFISRNYYFNKDIFIGCLPFHDFIEVME